MEWHAQLQALLASLLAGVPEPDRTILPAGEGVAISFQNHVDAALTAAFRLADWMRQDGSQPSRAGLHLGSLVARKDVNGMPSFFGEGINVAEHVMQHALVGEILVSGAFHVSVSDLSVAHRAAFRPTDGFTEENGRRIETFLLQVPEPALRAHLEQLYGASTPAPIPTTVPRAIHVAPPEAPPLTTQQQILKAISTWVFPFNALAAFVGLAISGLERLAPGGSLTRIGFAVSFGVAVLLVLLDVSRVTKRPHGLWLQPGAVLTRLASRATSVLAGVVTIMFGVGVLLLSASASHDTATADAHAPATPAAVTPSASSASSASSAPSAPVSVTNAVPSPAITTPAPPAMVAPAPPKVADRIPDAVPAPKATSLRIAKLPSTTTHRVESPSTVAAIPQAERSAAEPAGASRCSEIVMRASAGAPLTSTDRETLRTRC